MDIDTEFLYTAITRFGTVLFIVYAIGIMLNVYRYVMKMAAYHDARADALQLMHDRDDKEATRFAKFAESLDAEKIDFGKSPKTPMHQIVDLAKAIKK